MGFPQLLAANRSLRNMRNGPSRYKMTQANLLPRFGADPESGSAGRASVPVAGLPASRPSASRGVRGTLAVAALDRAPAPRFEPRQGQGELRSWWRRLVNPFGVAGGAAGRGPVQAELMLGAVEPVRNGLGENGLELFSATDSAAEPTGSGVAVEAGSAVPAAVRPGFWRRWAGSFFGRLGDDRA